MDHHVGRENIISVFPDGEASLLQQVERPVQSLSGRPLGGVRNGNHSSIWMLWKSNDPGARSQQP